jgi:Protein of unknown function (DUF3168)
MVARPMAALELRTAVQSLLTGDGDLMGIITGVFALPVPDGQVFPYISYGQHVDGPWSTFGKIGSELLFMLHIHTSGADGGDDQCYEIEAEVIRILQTTSSNPPLTLTNYGQASMQYEWSTALYDAESNTWNMPVRFRSRALETTLA